MFCKIELFPKKSIAQADAEELIWTFFCSLERNGQILKGLYANKRRELYNVCNVAQIRFF